MSSPGDSPAPLWSPTTAAIESSQLTAFTDWLADRHGLEFGEYADLWKWSTDEPDAFWRAIWEYFDVISSGSFDSALGSLEMPGTKWFEGAELNYAELRNKAKRSLQQ